MSRTYEVTDALTSPEAEEKLLGAYLLDSTALTLSDLKAEDFSDKRAAAFMAMRALAENDDDVSPVFVVATAKQQGGRGADKLDVTYLEDLMRVTTFIDTAKAETYEGIVREKALRRAALRTYQRVAKLLLDESQDVALLLDRAQQELSALSNNVDSSFLGGGVTSAEQGIALVEQIVQAQGKPLGHSTGLPKFDKLIGGLQPGQLMVLSAATGGGKSTLALQIAGSVAWNGKPVYYAALEDPADLCILKLASGRAGVNLQRFRDHPTERDRVKLVRALEALHHEPLYIDDRTGATLSQLRARARQVHQKAGGLGLIVVDYLQLMAGEGRQRETRAVEVGSFANGLKALAGELKIPVIALAQINRAGRNSGKRPDLADLRESGDIENAANVVAFLYREGYYDPNTDDPNKTELLVKKNRYGPQGVIYLQAKLEYSQFIEEADAI